MKSRLFAVVLVMALIGFSGCPGSKDKSSENRIKKFTVNSVEWTVSDNAGTITKLYNKTPPTGSDLVGTWAGLPTTWPNATATVELMDSKSTISPDPSVARNFENGTTKFTVTAENGDTKVYTIQGTKGGL